MAREVGWYYLAARYGEPGDYAGPDLLAEWYRRNIRIYNNVAKLVTGPEDRILVIFGYVSGLGCHQLCYDEERSTRDEP